MKTLTNMSSVQTAAWLLMGIALISGCPAPQPVAPTPPTPATVKSFTADPSEVASGERTTLSWEVENATSIAIRTASGREIPVAEATRQRGTVDVEVDASTVYVLTARGEGGSDTAVSAVKVAETDDEPLFSATPEEIVAGESTTLVWRIPGATQVTVTDDAGGTIYSGAKAAHAVQVRPTFDTVYTLTSGELSVTVSVQVQPAVVNFEASEVAVVPGGSVELTWQIGGATSIELSSSDRGVLHTADTPSEIADGSFTDTVPATQPLNTSVTYTLKATGPAGEVVRSAVVNVGVEPLFTTLDFPEYALQNAGFTVQWATALADHVEVLVEDEVVHQALTLSEVKGGNVFLPAPALGQFTKVTLRATNVRGGVTEETRRVEGLGVTSLIDFQADQTSITGGRRVTLSWKADHARNAVILADGREVARVTGTPAANGSVEVYPNQTTEYVLVADNTLGTFVTSAPEKITVTSSARFEFAPQPVPLNGTSNVVGHTVPGGGSILGLPHVVKNDPAAKFIDISATGQVLASSSTTEKYELPRNFTMPLFGQWVSTEWISVSEYGVMTLAADKPSVSSSNKPFPPGTSLYSNSFAPLWDDLEDDFRPDSRLLMQLDGYGYQQRLIVQWDRVIHDDDESGEVTFQVQLYGDGRVVYAYKTMQATTLSASIGVVNHDESEFLYPELSYVPAAGDTLTFFGPLDYSAGAAPVPVIALKTPRWARVDMGNGAFLEADATPQLMHPDAVRISEVMYNPTLADGEWFEVSNLGPDPVDLQGWTIDFGGDVTYTIPSSVILPANGQIVFGQTPSSAEEGTAGGAPVALAYGSGFSMPNDSGSLTLIGHGTPVTVVKWADAGTAGTSVQFDGRSVLRYSSTTGTAVSCPSTATFGANGQLGTPGAAHSLCFPWTLGPAAPNGFQAIALSGNVIWESTTLNGFDTQTVTVDFTAAGGRTVKIGAGIFGSAAAPLSVSSNGWVSTTVTNSTSSLGGSRPATGAPNSTLALFWDDLAGNIGTSQKPSGVYWQQFDPDGTPGSGDEYTLISWENWRRYQAASKNLESDLNFQLKILEATGDVEYHYGTMTATQSRDADGTDAAGWIEAPDGASALAIGSNEPWVVPHTGWRFTYTP